MAQKNVEYDWSKYPDITGMYNYTPEEEAYWPMQAVHPKWNIPEKVSIQCALTGGGARITPAQNPYHPGDNLDHVIEAATEVLELPVGPSVIHFDHDTGTCQLRDGTKVDYGDSYMYTVTPLLKKYGWDKMCTHINTLRGSFEQQMKPVVGGIAELTYTHARASRRWLEATIPFLQANEMKAEITIHVNSEIEMAERLLINTGLMPNPNMWVLLFSLPCKGPRWHFEYTPNPIAMCQALVNAVTRIREIDPDGFITVIAGGRPSRYIVTLALLLGVNIRVGMEDTVFKYPHKDDPCKNNAEEVQWAIDTAKLLGREVMTPNEFRSRVGLPEKHGFEPYLK